MYSPYSSSVTGGITMINFPSVFQIFSKRLCSRLDSVLSTEENVILTNSLRDLDVKNLILRSRAGSRAAATSKTECFVIMIIIKRSILDVAAALDPPLKGTTTWCLFSSVLCLFIYTYISQKVNEFVRLVGELFWLFTSI